MYYEDEYDCYDGYDDEPEIIGYDYYHYVCKAKNGQLYHELVELIRWDGQDWGECDTQSSTNSIHVLKDHILDLAIQWSRTAENDTYILLDDLKDTK